VRLVQHEPSAYVDEKVLIACEHFPIDSGAKIVCEIVFHDEKNSMRTVVREVVVKGDEF